MSDIWKIIADIGVELPPARIDVVANGIASFSSNTDLVRNKAIWGPFIEGSLIDDLDAAWRRNSQLSPLEVAAALRGASGTATLLSSREAVEMVWTGPSSGLVASRHTEQVLLEVINSARRKLFLVSFVAYDFASFNKALKDAVGRNVTINILLESSKEHGGKINIDSIASFKKALPSAHIYAWAPSSKKTEKGNGAVHAKCAVSDGSLAFITSANLTRAAMENNMELGTLIRGGTIPGQLERHLEALITTKVLVKI